MTIKSIHARARRVKRAVRVATAANERIRALISAYRDDDDLVIAEIRGIDLEWALRNAADALDEALRRMRWDGSCEQPRQRGMGGVAW